MHKHSNFSEFCHWPRRDGREDPSPEASSRRGHGRAHRSRRRRGSECLDFELAGLFGHRHGGCEDDADDARFFGGRGHRGGPFGHGGHNGWRGGGSRGFGGGPPGFGFRMGRKLSSADLQLLLLTLLDEKPRHGYDLIKAIEARSNGFYVPSPGVIYPALTYLEEAGEAVSEADGSRKLFQLTDAGRERLQAQRADADALLNQLDELGQRMNRVREAFAGGDVGDERASLRDLWSAFPEILEVMHELRSVLVQHRRAKRKHWSRIAAAVKRAAAEIREAIHGDDSDSDE